MTAATAGELLFLFLPLRCLPIFSGPKHTAVADLHKSKGEVKQVNN